MADADTTSHILLNAGFGEPTFTRCDIEITIGRDLEEAVSLITALGPAAEAIRLAGEAADELRPRIEAALREGLAEFVREDGSVSAPASTWIVSAQAAG